MSKRDCTIIQFPGRGHDRASTGSSDPNAGDLRAASEAMRAAVTPADLAVGVSKIDCHHSSGIRSRCDHLRTANTLALISPAISSGEAHRPMISRNELGEAMTLPLGQFVLKCKAILSRDCAGTIFDNPGMADRMAETKEKLAFIARVRSARIARFDTQTPMCTILGIEQGTYKQYEIRTPLPHRFIPKFVAATGVKMEWLLANEGKGPPIVAIPKKQKRTQQRRKTALIEGTTRRI